MTDDIFAELRRLAAELHNTSPACVALEIGDRARVIRTVSNNGTPSVLEESTAAPTDSDFAMPLLRIAGCLTRTATVRREHAESEARRARGAVEAADLALARATARETALREIFERLGGKS